MNTIIKYIMGAAALLAAASCAKNVNWDEPVPGDGQPGISLQFTNSALTTKATVPGVNQENRVDRIRFFVFPATETQVTEGEGENATTKTVYTVADDAEYIFSGSYDGEDGNGWTYTAATESASEKWVYAKTMTTEELQKLFPNGAMHAKVFAVANYVGFYGSNNSMAHPDTNFPEDKKTWKELHDIEVGATFFYDDGTKDFGLRWPHVMRPYEYTVGESTDKKKDDLFFVMTSEADLVLNKTDVSKADCPLERLASKVTATFTYENYREEKTDGASTNVIMWVPQESAGETRVYLSNAIEHTTLGGPLNRSYKEDSWANATKPLGNGTRDIFEYAYNFMNDVQVVDGKKVAHFYTYPIQLENGDDNQPYLKLVLPWIGYKWIGEGTAPARVEGDITTNPNWMLYKQKEVYYKIVLPRETISKPNHIYEFTVNVNIIGSDKEVKIIGEQYVVKDWLSDEAISSNVATGRYISLELPKDEYDMYVDKIDINFVSSGTVVAQIDSIYQLNYSQASRVTKDIFMLDSDVPNTATQGNPSLLGRKGVTVDDVKGWVTIPQNTSYLEINHTMDNRLMVGNAGNSAFDMSPYVYIVTLHLVEAGTDTAFDRTIKITQYPSLFVASKWSDGYVFINEYDYSDTYCYDDEGNRLGNIANSPKSLDGEDNDNDNPNNYIISVSMLPDAPILPNNEKAIIGDPRNPEVSNLTFDGLTNYHPTLRTGTKGVISPKFIVSSSYSALQNTRAVNLANAERRCAAYQENGYPAGRWRVPTAAEIMFMAKLSKYGFIPSLFNFTTSSAGYWSANGRLTGSGSGEPSLNENDTTTTSGIRCVYDIWYWGEEQIDNDNNPTTTSPATTWRGYHD